MELSQLRAFVSVSRLGTITAAAEDLHVTPSPLSRTIRDLERQLGGPLFTRSYHQFERTDLGERFLPLAVELVAQAEEALRFGEEERRMPRIGGTPWTSRSLTRRLVETADAVVGGTTDFTADLSSVLLESLRHGDLDLVLVHLPVGDPGVCTVPLAKYSYAVAAVGDDAFGTDRPLRLADLAGHRLLSMPLIMHPKGMQRFLDQLRTAGVESITEIDLRDMVGLQGRMARTGEVMLITPSDDLPTARFFDLDQTNVYHMQDGELIFEVGLAWRDRDSVNRDIITAITAAMIPDEVPYLR